MSGLLERRGKEALDAVNLYFDEVNRQGGVRGHPLELIPYDDADKPEIASAKAREVAASQALVVIGHFTSPTSLAGGKIYREASIPAITAFATVPAITAGNPYYFRLAIESSAQGHMLAAYAKSVLGQGRARIIFSDEAYGRSLRAAFIDDRLCGTALRDSKQASLRQHQECGGLLYQGISRLHHCSTCGRGHSR